MCFLQIITKYYKFFNTHSEQNDAGIIARFTVWVWNLIADTEGGT